MNASIDPTNALWDDPAIAADPSYLLLGTTEKQDKKNPSSMDYKTR